MSYSATNDKWVPANPKYRAVVYVTGFEQKASTDSSHQMIQKNKTFVPRILPITKGQTVNFPNSDPVFHNVFSLSKSNPLDLGSYMSPNSKPHTFNKTGLVKVFCNIHSDMIGSILVLKNNSYTTTDEKGNYAIKGIPNGKWKLRVWTEGPRVKPVKIVVKNNSKSNHDFTAKIKLRSSNHMNKDGKPYKSDYKY